MIRTDEHQGRVNNKASIVTKPSEILGSEILGLQTIHTKASEGCTDSAGPKLGIVPQLRRFFYMASGPGT